jgi:predicted GNAT family acetyltransferase
MQICKGHGIWTKKISSFNSNKMMIEHITEGSRGRFLMKGDQDDTVAELAYDQKSGDTMIIEHTYVEEALRGKDLGERLIEEAVEYARNHQLKIQPVCSFARAVFRLKREYNDVYVQSA